MTTGASPQTLTEADVEAGLRALGVARGMALEVHSSLSAFGTVDGGADTVIDALLNVIGPDGAVVMPAFPYSPPQPITDEETARGLVLKLRLLDPDTSERTGMGVVADTFRRRPDVVTGPGFHRVCAWGKDVDEHSRSFQHLLDMDGWALLLGVDIHCLSTMHYAEDRAGGVPAEITACFAATADLKAEYPSDRWYVEVGRTPEDAWGKIQAEAFRLGLVREQLIGSARCLLFRAAAVTTLYEEDLRADPYRLFGVRHEPPGR